MSVCFLPMTTNQYRYFIDCRRLAKWTVTPHDTVPKQRIDQRIKTRKSFLVSLIKLVYYASQSIKQKLEMYKCN